MAAPLEGERSEAVNPPFLLAKPALWFLFILTLCCLLAAPAPAAPPDPSPAEQFVLQQVAKGEVADLKAQFGEAGKSRTLSAPFLTNLFIGTYKVHWKGIKIKNAVISQTLDLILAHIPHNVYLVGCRFEAPISCRDAVFEKHFDLTDSHFEKEVDFHRLKVKINLFCRSSEFHGPVNFAAADIGGQFSASGANFHHPTETADFNALKVDHDAFFRNVIFQGPVDFGAVNIGGQLSANRAGFLNEKATADFNGMKVGQSAFFDNATFQGPAEFRGADIGGQFSGRGIKFNNKEQEADFNALKVGQSAFFDNATFQGPVDFVTATIGAQFNANGAKFLHETATANFNALKVGQGAFFRNANFHGPVNFGTADICGQFSAKGAEFHNKEQLANFNALKVGLSAFFDNATFQGPVVFLGADIGRQFSADGANFLNASQDIDFSGMRVGQGAFFRGVVFKSPVDLTYGTHMHLLIEGDPEKQEGFIELSLKGTTVQRQLLVKDFNLAALNASFLRVTGPATFAGLTIKKPDDAPAGQESDLQASPIKPDLKPAVDFQQAVLETLNFENITWPEKPADLKLNGLTYTSLAVQPPEPSPGFMERFLDYLLGVPPDFQGFKRLIARSDFNPQNYLQLEDYCKHIGHKDWANEIYIAMKDRELEQKHWYNPLRWLEWAFWGRLAGYGRQPYRAFGLGLVIVVIGALWVFDPRYFKGKGEAAWPLSFYHWHRAYSPDLKEYLRKRRFPGIRGDVASLFKLTLLRFLISLDQFIPGINLKIADYWQPPQLNFKTWCWLQFQAISGWVLVPIGLAAIFSQLK